MRRSQRLAARERNGVAVVDDRISDLEDELLHHIFSFLDIELVVRTSILSKRWRYVWKSTPTVNIPLDDIIKQKPSCFFDPFFLNRDTKSRLEKLEIRSDQVLRSIKLCNWINSITIGTIDELNLKIRHSYALKAELLPDCFFTSGIKKLRLSTRQLLPITMCSAECMQILILTDVTFPDGDSDGELILSCPVLKILVMENCEINHLKTLTISTPRLEHIKLYVENGSVDCKKNLCCPMLESLYWCSIFTDEISVTDYSALTKVTLVSLCFCCLGFEPELRFMRCLFENAKVLKKMVIYHSVYVCEKLKEFKDKVFALPRASSDLSISLISYLNYETLSSLPDHRVG